MKAKGLTVIEIPYDATVYAPGPRELDLYKQEKVYDAANLATDIISIRYDHENYPPDTDTFESQIALGKVIANKAVDGFKMGNHVLMVGGNCGPAVALSGALRQAFPEKRIGFVWFDAHGDLNTPKTSLSGMIGGMPFGVCWGNSLSEWRQAVGLVPPFNEEDCLLADARNLDPLEKEMLHQSQVVHLNTEQFCDTEAFASAFKHIADKVDVIYLHIDADILDGKYVPDHKTIEDNGPEMDEVKRAIQVVMNTGKVKAFAVVSVYFPNGKPGKDISAQSGLELVRQGLASWKI
ncbi:MAG: arginase [Clostridia bacterium]|nr:arginase [Clostridia bacterium]